MDTPSEQPDSTGQSNPQGSQSKPEPVADSQHAPPQKIVLEQPGGMFGRFGKLLWIALLVSVFFNIGQRTAYQNYFTGDQAIEEKYHSLKRTAQDKIAIITVKGTILDGEGFVKRQIDQVRQDKKVKAVVLRIDSPGGTVTGSDYLYHHAKKLVEEREIPLVVSMGSLCASGGYYVAMAVGDQQEAIFAEPTTWTGSIGVIIPHYDLSGMLESWHIKDDSVRSHEYKQLLSPTRSLSEEENPEARRIMQALVDDSFEGFKEVVRSGRPIFRDNDAALDMVATGQIFTARQALEYGLVDKLGFIEEAIERAAELAGVSTDNVRVIKYSRPPGLIGSLTSGQATDFTGGGLNLQKLLDMTAPRAYYLYTWMPSLLTNSRQ